MFTIRVYGLLVHNGAVLVSDELIKGQRITKFPGGGLKFGEGLKECLVREIHEEMGMEATDLAHFYTTDFFQQSAFHTSPMQVVSVYFTFRIADPSSIPIAPVPFMGLGNQPGQEVFRWLPLKGSSAEAISLPIDRLVLGIMKEGSD